MLASVNLPTAQRVAELKARLQELTVRYSSPAAARLPTGMMGALDRLLPEEGVAPGSLLEWLAQGEGQGATSLALRMAVEICRQPAYQGRGLVVVERNPQEQECQGTGLYPPVALAWGIEARRLAVVRPGSARDETWVLDQALRDTSVAAVLAWPQGLSSRMQRRLQLAAEAGGTVGLWIRPAALRQEPSWATMRWLVEGIPSTTSRAGCDPLSARQRRLRVHLLRCRGVPEGTIDVELDHASGAVRLAAELAYPTAARRAANH